MSQDTMVSGIFTLTPAESKRLIAKGVAAMPQVQAALERGRIVIAGGTTNAFVAEELLGIPVDKALYSAGNIADGGLGVTDGEHRIPPYVLVDGEPVSLTMAEALAEFTASDIFIKGANAIDTQGAAGIILGGGSGGTIATALGVIAGRGAHLIMPVGLEKLVPSVIVAARKCGQQRLKYPEGGTVGMMPVVNGTIVTEIQALGLLAGVAATHVASGGIGGSEGSVVLVVEGSEEQVQAAFDLINGIKGEPPVPSPGPAARRYGTAYRSGA